MRNRISEWRPEVAARERVRSGLNGGHASDFRVFRGYSLWLACAFAVVACLALVGCDSTPGPADYAQATAISRAASARATVTAQAVQIKATVAAQKAAERQATAGARSFTVGLLWLTLGISGLTLGVGSAFALVGWLHKRATAVYPNSAGQYPVIIRRYLSGATFVHDPNRALGPTTLYTAPSLLEDLLSLVRPRPSQAAPPAITAHYPQPASEETMLQVTTQAQVGQTVAAHNRWPKLPGVVAGRVTQHVEAAADGQMHGGLLSPGDRRSLGDRMSPVRIVKKQDEIDQVESLFTSRGI